MNTITIENLNVAEWTTNPEIYDLYIKTEGKEKWLYINGDSGFLLSGKKPFTIGEAIENYLSPEHKEWSDYCFRKAWGFYD